MSGSMKVYEARLGQYQWPSLNCPNQVSLQQFNKKNWGCTTGHWYPSTDEHCKQKAQKGCNSRRETWATSLPSDTYSNLSSQNSQLLQQTEKRDGGKKPHYKAVWLNICSSCTNNKSVWVLRRHAAQQGSIQSTTLRGPHKSRMLARAAKIRIWYQVGLQV